MLALADFRDVFEVLERFDVALAHDWFRNSALHHTFWRKPLPPAFPQFNGGLIALRRTPATTAFLHDWKAAVRASDTGRDQISLRELLWDSDLRIATLPEEYNLLWIQGLRDWTTDFAAPRIIHSPNFHRDYARYARSRRPGRRAHRAGRRRASCRCCSPPTGAWRGCAAPRRGRPAPGDRRAVLGRLLAGLPARLIGRLRRAAGR